MVAGLVGFRSLEQVLARFEGVEEREYLGAIPYDWKAVLLLKERGLELRFPLVPAMGRSWSGSRRVVKTLVRLLGLKGRHFLVEIEWIAHGLETVLGSRIEL